MNIKQQQATETILCFIMMALLFWGIFVVVDFLVGVFYYVFLEDLVMDTINKTLEAQQ